MKMNDTRPMHLDAEVFFCAAIRHHILRLKKINVEASDTQIRFIADAYDGL